MIARRARVQIGTLAHWHIELGVKRKERSHDVAASIEGEKGSNDQPVFF
jgi:hypothetical protein